MTKDSLAYISNKLVQKMQSDFRPCKKAAGAKDTSTSFAQKDTL
jgi:hypothetical protein